MEKPFQIESALRTNVAKRVKISIHLLEGELSEYKALARERGIGFEALVRAALRILKATLTTGAES
jgi:hypothetical protein